MYRFLLDDHFALFDTDDLPGRTIVPVAKYEQVLTLPHRKAKCEGLGVDPQLFAVLSVSLPLIAKLCRHPQVSPSSVRLFAIFLYFRSFCVWLCFIFKCLASEQRDFGDDATEEAAADHSVYTHCDFYV